MATIPLAEWLRQKPFRLNLSSAFFGFYAHSGAVAALYESGLYPRSVSGCSAGALVAAGLASGLEPERMKEIFFRLEKKDFWDPGPGLGLLRGRKFQRLLEEHFSPTFSDTEIPLEVCVFDLFSCRTRFLREGLLGKAVAASCAVPFLFQPVRIGSRLYLDGGVFHKTGLNPERQRERTFCLFLESKGTGAAWERRRARSALGRSSTLLGLAGLPAVLPHRLGEGRAAYRQAYLRVKKALQLPQQPWMEA